MSWRIPRFTTLQLLLAAALCALLLGLATASWRATDFAQVTAVAFSSNGRYLAAGYESGAIQVWDISSGKLKRVSAITSCRSGTYWTEGFSFLDESHLIAARPNNALGIDILCCIDVRNGKVNPFAEKLFAPAGPFDAAGGTLAYLHPKTGEVRCYSGKQSNLQLNCEVARPAWNLAIARDGKSLVVLDQSGGAAVIDTKTGAEAYRVNCTHPLVATLGNSLAYGDETGIGVVLVNLESGEQRILTPLSYGLSWLEYSTDGSRLAFANLDEFVAIDSKSGNEVGRLVFPRSPGYLLPFQSMGRSVQGRGDYSLGSEGKQLATFHGNEVQIWDIEAGKLKTRIQDHSRTLQTIFFIALFIAWSAGWGIVARRNTERVRKVAKTAGIGGPAAAVTMVHSPAAKPPSELIFSWGLMFIGGLVAMALPIYLFVHAGPVQWPMMYVSLFTGIAATAKGAGRQTTGLLWVTRGQLLNLLACDPINFVLGTLAFALLKRPHVRQYLALVNDLARSLR